MYSFPNPLSDSSQKPRASSDNLAISLIFFLAGLPAIISYSVFILTSGELQKNRQIILDVPETSRVDAQVTSENTTLNLQNL